MRRVRIGLEIDRAVSPSRRRGRSLPCHPQATAEATTKIEPKTAAPRRTSSSARESRSSTLIATTNTPSRWSSTKRGTARYVTRPCGVSTVSLVDSVTDPQTSSSGLSLQLATGVAPEGLAVRNVTTASPSSGTFRSSRS